MIKLMSNRVKYKTTLIIILMLSSLLVLAGCGSGVGGGATAGGGSGVTSVAINISVDSNNSSSSGGLSVADVPKAVKSIEVRISGAGMDTIVDQFNVSPGDNVTRVYEVPTGSDRTFAIMAYNAPLGVDSLLLYYGETMLNLDGTATTVDITPTLFDIDHAFEYLNRTGDLAGAEDLFRAAVIKHQDEGSVSENQANFFYAITRVLALWSDLYNYAGVDYGLYTMTEVTDIIHYISLPQNYQQNPGCVDLPNITHSDITDPLDAYFTAIFCPNELPPNFPIAGLQDFLYDTLLPALEAAIVNITAVPESFYFEWTDAINWTHANGLVESDYGDVLMLKAVFQTLLAALETQDMNNKKGYMLDALSNINNTVGAMKVITLEVDAQDNDWINLTDPDLLFNEIQVKHSDSEYFFLLW